MRELLCDRWMVRIAVNGITMGKKALTGNIYGDIKALEYIGNKKYKCQCIRCGNISEMFSSNLYGEIECQKCNKKGFRVDLTDKRYGLLTVESYNSESKKWVCRCECGKYTEVKSNNLKHCNTQSCGKCKYIQLARKDVVAGTRVSQINKKVSKNNTSGVTGVGFNKRKSKWYAAIRFCGKSYWLGYHDKKEDAIGSRKSAEEKLHGDFLEWYKNNFFEEKSGDTNDSL